MIEIELSEKLAKSLKVIQIGISTVAEDKITSYGDGVSVWRNSTLVYLKAGTPDFIKEIYQIAGDLASRSNIKNVKVVNNNSIHYTIISTRYIVHYNQLEDFLTELHLHDYDPVVIHLQNPTKGIYYAAATEEYN